MAWVTNWKRYEHLLATFTSTHLSRTVIVKLFSASLEWAGWWGLAWLTYYLNHIDSKLGQTALACLGVDTGFRLLAARRRQYQTKIKDLELKQVRYLTHLGKLTPGLIHDIVTPLNTIQLSLSELEPEIVQPCSPGRHALDRATRNAYKITTYLATIREHLQQQTRLQTFSPVQEINFAIEAVYQKCVKCNVEIEFVATTQRDITGNPLRFYQLVLNLLTNAIDSYPTTNANTQLVGVRLQATAHELQLLIEDHGCGMTPSLTRRMFEPFFTTKTTQQGTGLGLALCREIVAEFRGQIMVNSHPQQGTTFQIGIPWRG